MAKKKKIGIYDSYPLYVDAVISNPPYSQQWDPGDKDGDPRFSGFGLAPKSKADYAFLLHALFHLKSDGIMTIVFPHGVLFRGGAEAQIRENLIEQNHIDAIIGLPENIFFGTSIPTIIMVLKKHRDNEDVLIIDASKGFEKAGKQNVLRARDIKKIVDTIKDRSDIEKFSRKVSRKEIRENSYNLNLSRYIDSNPSPEKHDLYAMMFGGVPDSELEDFNQYWKQFPNLKESLFKKINDSYYSLNVEDINKAVYDSPEVKAFFKKYEEVLSDFGLFLKKQLIENSDDRCLSKKETEIGEDLFRRLENIPLIDKYEAWQILDTSWQAIAADLEVSQEWIILLLSELQKVPVSQLDGFIQALEKLAHKYDQTLEDLDREIAESEKELAGMLRKLTGNEFDMAGVNKMIELLESGL